MKPSYTNTARLSLPLATAITALVAASAASAQSTWTGTTDGSWQTGTNWGGTAPAFNSSTALIFHSSTVNVLATYLGSAARTINSLTFNANVANTVGISLSSATATSARNLTFAGTSPECRAQRELGHRPRRQRHSNHQSAGHGRRDCGHQNGRWNPRSQRQQYLLRESHP
jgi:hypothetical protein